MKIIQKNETQLCMYDSYRTKKKKKKKTNKNQQQITNNLNKQQTNKQMGTARIITVIINSPSKACFYSLVYAANYNYSFVTSYFRIAQPLLLLYIILLYRQEQTYYCLIIGTGGGRGLTARFYNNTIHLYVIQRDEKSGGPPEGDLCTSSSADKRTGSI